MTSPCEEKGWEVGQVFEILGGSNNMTDNGDFVALQEDDGTNSPWFYIIKGRNKGERTCRNIDDNSRIKRIYPPEEESKEITLTCDESGKKTTMSRESAKAMNLV